MGRDHHGTVEAVCASAERGIAKQQRPSIRLVEGSGVEGDIHAGPVVQHASRLVKTPGAPNLRQVHLVAAELHDELRAGGFAVGPGDMGENVTTRGVDLLALPTGTRLRLGADAVVELTGLRNPCVQLDGVQAGLRQAVLGRDAGGGLVRRAGVMGVVVAGGDVRPGDPVGVELPLEPHRRLEPV